jgi:hypothetical protein
MRLEKLLNVASADGADFLGDDLPSLKDQKSGDAADVVAHGGSAIFIDVQLADFGFRRIRPQSRPRWGHHAAGRTIRPKNLQAPDVGVQDIFVPAGVGKSRVF